MNPKQQYTKDIQDNLIFPDTGQEYVVDVMQNWFEQWQAQQQPRSIWQRIFTKRQPLNGIYLWGGVGIGKTYLMDLLYESIPSERKRRLHFHQFMEQVHSDLRRLQGKPNPLTIIAREFSMHADVLCFDEFMVHDIADAMILAELLAALFARGISLIATSNIPPAELYRNGLQRVRFLPAIKLIQQHCRVLNLESHTDYRQRHLEQSGVYFTPLDQKAEQAMQACFTRLALHPLHGVNEVSVWDRQIPTQAQGADVIWFDFNNLCVPPRSQRDYLFLAENYTTILISNVPQLSHGNSVRYFIHLVDICYDLRVKLIVSAAVPVGDLYPQGALSAEFQRTESRLVEMQSTEYWGLGR